MQGRSGASSLGKVGLGGGGGLRRKMLGWVEERQRDGLWHVQQHGRTWESGGNNCGKESRIMGQWRALSITSLQKGIFEEKKVGIFG